RSAAMTERVSPLVGIQSPEPKITISESTILGTMPAGRIRTKGKTSITISTSTRAHHLQVLSLLVHRTHGGSTEQIRQVASVQRHSAASPVAIRQHRSFQSQARWRVR